MNAAFADTSVLVAFLSVYDIHGLGRGDRGVDAYDGGEYLS